MSRRVRFDGPEFEADTPVVQQQSPPATSPWFPKIFMVSVRVWDWPMGCSPAYAVQRGLTKEEAEAVAKEKNDAEDTSSGFFREYIVEEDT